MNYFANCNDPIVVISGIGVANQTVVRVFERNDTNLDIAVNDKSTA